MGVLSGVSNGGKDLIAAVTATAGALFVMSKIGGKTSTNRSKDDKELQLSALGLRNLGNTCFMNAVLQGLASSKPFLVYLESIFSNIPEKFHKELPFTKALWKCLSQLTAVVVEAGSRPKGGTVNPAVLEAHLRAEAKQFSRLGDQQDSDEFFHLVLDFVETEVAKWEKNSKSRRGVTQSQLPGLGSIAADVNSPQPVSSRREMWFRRNKTSFLPRLIQRDVGNECSSSDSETSNASSDQSDVELEIDIQVDQENSAPIVLDESVAAKNNTRKRRSKLGLSLFNRQSASEAVSKPETQVDSNHDHNESSGHPPIPNTAARVLDIQLKPEGVEQQDSLKNGKDVDSSSYFTRVLQGRKRSKRHSKKKDQVCGNSNNHEDARESNNQSTSNALQSVPLRNHNLSSSMFISSVSPRLGPMSGISNLPMIPVLNAAIRSPLEGTFLNQLVCCRCRIKSPLTTSKYSVLTLSIVAPTGSGALKPLRTLSQCLDEFTSPEYVEDVECTYCKRIDGKGRQQARKQMMLGRLPKMLCVHFQRNHFDARSMMMSKITSHVECPLIVNVHDYCFNSFLSFEDKTPSQIPKSARPATQGRWSGALDLPGISDPLWQVLGVSDMSSSMFGTLRRRRADSALPDVVLPSKELEQSVGESNDGEEPKSTKVELGHDTSEMKPSTKQTTVDDEAMEVVKLHLDELITIVVLQSERSNETAVEPDKNQEIHAHAGSSVLEPTIVSSGEVVNQSEAPIGEAGIGVSEQSQERSCPTIETNNLENSPDLKNNCDTDSMSFEDKFDPLLSPAPVRRNERRNTIVAGCVTRSKPEVLYSLAAIVVHQGGANGGHFSTYRRILASDVNEGGAKVKSSQQ